MRRPIAILIAALLVPQLVSSQTLTPGSRVRVSHPFAGIRTGTVVALTPDTLEMRLGEDSVSVHLPLVEVTRLEVSRGKRRHMSDAAVGLVVGAAVGAVAGYATGDNDCSHEFICFDRSATAAIGGIFFGGLGGVIGLVKGVIPTETWERVPLQARRVSLVAAPSGRGGGLRFSF
jgi:hypothetical protein